MQNIVLKSWIQRNVVVFIFVCCHGNSLKLGIISKTPNTMNTKSVDCYQYNLTLDGHIVDTSEIYQVFRAVQIMDRDSTIDAIVLLDDQKVDKQLEHLLIPKNKPLIHWVLKGHEDQKNQQLLEDLNKFIPNCSNECKQQNTLYCRTDLKLTAKHSDLRSAAFVLEAVLSPVIRLSWKHVIIFYETDTEHEVSGLVDMLSKEGTMFIMFNIEDVRDIHQLLHRIYVKRVDNEPINSDMNFIIVCKTYYTMLILQKASYFDRLNTGTSTSLKTFSRWLIAGYDYCKCIYDTLHYSCDLDNVAVIALPTEPRTSEDFYLTLNKTMNDVSRRALNSDYKYFNVADTVIQRLTEASRSVCKGYIIETLLWRENGREFVKVGYVETSGKLRLDSDIFPNMNYGYNKRMFIVSTLPYPPFVVKSVKNGTIVYEGFSINVVEELSNVLNFTYTIMEPPDGLWGDFASKDNLTFNGLIGQLQRKEVDIVASAIAETPERHLAVDFSYPLYYEYTSVIVKKPIAQKWRKLLDPLKYKVLVSVGVALIVVTVLTFLIEKWNPYYLTEEHSKQRNEMGGLHRWPDAFWYIYGAVLCQGGVHLPDSISGRTLVSFWWIFCIIIVGTYCGNLIAFLTVTKEIPPFNTLEEMVELKGQYRWGTLGSSNWETILKTSTHPVYSALGNGMMEFSKSDPDVLNPYLDVHLNKVMEGNYVWIGDKTSIEQAMLNECSLITTKEMFIPMSIALGLINNSPHGPILSAQMMKMHEVGLFAKWKRKWWPKANLCSGGTIPEAKPISLDDVQSAFYVCCIGITFGVVVLCIEICLNKYRKRIRKSRGSGGCSGPI